MRNAHDMENWKRPLERLLCRHVGGCDFPPEGLESRSVFKWLYEEGMNSLFQTKYKNNFNLAWEYRAMNGYYTSVKL